jgi:hypothetical protein
MSGFVIHADNFIAWCETPHDQEPGQSFYLEALRRLAELYLAGLSIPELEEVEIPDVPDPSLEERKRVLENLKPLPFQYYWEVYTPSALDGDKEPVCGDLFDDFVDIYVDLVRGSRLHQRGYPEAADFSWRFSFGVHWGRHAVSALHALHSWEPTNDADRDG